MTHDPHLERLRRLADLGDEAASRELERARARRRAPLDEVAHTLLEREPRPESRARVQDRLAGLVDPEPELRALALSDLVGRHNVLAPSLPLLEHVLDDPAPVVRRTVAELLATYRAAIASWLAIGSNTPCILASLRILVRLLHDADADVRERASRLFAELDLAFTSPLVAEPGALRRQLREHSRELALEDVAALTVPWCGRPSPALLKRALRSVRDRRGARRPWSRVECLWMMLELFACIDTPRDDVAQLARALHALSPAALAALVERGLLHVTDATDA